MKKSPSKTIGATSPIKQKAKDNLQHETKDDIKTSFGEVMARIVRVKQPKKK